MNDKLIDYIGELQQRIAVLRDRKFEEGPEERLTSEAVVDALELVVRELTDLLEVR
ncbi:hypothetical protein [Arenibaculum pallidiluteum]|uniref:hypothetical protein n=1 Tax=Arenibaculum pallidiluteum TaxID=2812559 RepID=UPI001A958CF0|nr:hypothetical protein [Arenibaculum pallidiluteum]